MRREIARAQRISEGQNFDIRRTLARYAAVVERQGEILAERRELVLREGSPGAFGVDPARRDELVRLAGEPAVIEAERRIVLGAIDLAWCEHLAYCADVREGIHLEHIGGRDPLTEFTRQAIAAFCTVWFDDVTRTGEFEPVGVAPEYQGRGLGKAIMCEGLRRLKRLGAADATVAGYSEAANALYASVMSPDHLLMERWEKSW